MNTLNPLLLNNTRQAENQIIFFNRVPKVGSQTFMELLRRLSIRNNFRFHRDAVQRVETIRLSPYQQEEMAEMISELPTPSGNNINNEKASFSLNIFSLMLYLPHIEIKINFVWIGVVGNREKYLVKNLHNPYIGNICLDRNKNILELN